MKKFLCWLTGGHRYADVNLVSRYEQKIGKSYLSNHCIKCGKRYHFILDTDRLIQEDMERMKNRLSFYPINIERSDNNAE